MRFTTWSTFTNALIISTVALLSLIQAANAQASAFVGDSPIVYIISPNGIEPASYNPGAQMLIQWYLYNVTALPRTEVNATLRNDDIDTDYYFQELSNVYNYGTAQKTSGADTLLFNNIVVLPVGDVIPSKNYYIKFSTYFGNFTSADFTIV